MHLATSPKTQISASKLGLLLADLHRVVDHFHDDVWRLRHHVRALFASVYLHDTFTCPARVQHALVELARTYELSGHHLGRGAAACLAESFDVLFPDDCLMALAAFHTLRADQPLFPSSSQIEPHLSVIQKYLESDPGSLISKLKNKWNSGNDTETPRVHFSHKLFDSGLLDTSAGQLRRPSHPSDTLASHLRTLHHRIEKTLRHFDELLEAYIRIMDYLDSSSSNCSSPDDAALVALSHSSAVELSLRLQEVLHRKWGLSVPCAMETIQYASGWKFDWAAKYPHGSTVEDALGPFEKWAT